MDLVAHCTERVRAEDRDRFLSSLYAPESVRGDLLALYAFDLEVGNIARKVSDPTLGEIRLEWWRQAVRGDHQGNPIGAAVSEAIARHNLPIEAIDNLLQARAFDLYHDAMPTTGDLEGYCGDTVSAITQLSAIMLGGGAQQTAEVAGFSGVAGGIVGILQHLPHTASRGQCFLPQDRMVQLKATREDLQAGKATPEMQAVVEELLTLADRRLNEARLAMKGFDRSVMPAFLPLAMVAPSLKVLGRTGRDPLKPLAPLSPLRRQWAIWQAVRRGKI